MKNLEVKKVIENSFLDIAERKQVKRW